MSLFKKLFSKKKKKDKVTPEVDKQEVDSLMSAKGNTYSNLSEVRDLIRKLQVQQQVIQTNVYRNSSGSYFIPNPPISASLEEDDVIKDLLKKFMNDPTKQELIRQEKWDNLFFSFSLKLHNLGVKQKCIGHLTDLLIKADIDFIPKLYRPKKIWFESSKEFMSNDTNNVLHSKLAYRLGEIGGFKEE